MATLGKQIFKFEFKLKGYFGFCDIDFHVFIFVLISIFNSVNKDQLTDNVSSEICQS